MSAHMAFHLSNAVGPHRRCSPVCRDRPLVDSRAGPRGGRGEPDRRRSNISQVQLNDLLEKENLGPIMSIVGQLPKEELAEMAEALMNLTSLKRRVTPAAGTVGGPVDVAVISKGDGLVWMKRKHYFAPELNPRYFERDRKL